MMIHLLRDPVRVLSERSIYAGNAIEEENSIAERLVASGKTIISLNRGDPPCYFKTPKYIIDAYIKALKDGRTYYSNPLGVKELREAVSERYARMYGVNSGYEDVVVTQGLSEALFFINAMLIDRGDRAAIFSPYFTEHLITLELYGGIRINAAYDEQREWNVDLDQLDESLKKERAARNKVKYILITNPNNPTGTVLQEKTLRGVVEIAKNYGITFISDEIYDEIVYNGAKFNSIGEFAKGVPHMILHGASKVYDSTGFRLGFVIIPENDARSQEMKEKLKDFAKIRLSANTPSQYAIAEALKNVEEHNKAIEFMGNKIAKRVNFACGLVNKSEYMHAVVPKGAFYIFPKLHIDKLSIKDDKEFVRRLLLEEGVHLTRGSGFGESNHIRIVALQEEKVLESAIAKINKFCERNKR